jgi:hypothetical protein
MRQLCSPPTISHKRHASQCGNSCAPTCAPKLRYYPRTLCGGWPLGLVPKLQTRHKHSVLRQKAWNGIKAEKGDISLHPSSFHRPAVHCCTCAVIRSSHPNFVHLQFSPIPKNDISRIKSSIHGVGLKLSRLPGSAYKAPSA